MASKQAPPSGATLKKVLSYNNSDLVLLFHYSLIRLQNKTDDGGSFFPAPSDTSPKWALSMHSNGWMGSLKKRRADQ